MVNARLGRIAGILVASTLLLLARQVGAQGFDAGDLVIDRVGDGTTSLTDAAAAVFLDEYKTTPSLTGPVRSFALETTGSNALTQTGFGGSEGYLNLSADGRSLLLAGYNASVGTASARTSPGPRVVAVFGSSGTQTSLTQLGSALYSTPIRSATSADGVTLYASGESPSIYRATAGTNGATVVNPGESTPSGINDLEICNNNLYYSAAGGIYKVGSGLPQSSATSTKIISVSGTPYGFSVTPDGQSAFVLDSAGLIKKYTLASDGSTVSAETAYYDSGKAGATGLTVAYSGSGANTVATFYFVTPTNLYSVKDTISGGVDQFSQFSTLATALPNEAFRGLDFAPSGVPEPATCLGGALAVLTMVGAMLRRFVPTISPRGTNPA